MFKHHVLFVCQAAAVLFCMTVLRGCTEDFPVSPQDAFHAAVQNSPTAAYEEQEIQDDPENTLFIYEENGTMLITNVYDNVFDELSGRWESINSGTPLRYDISNDGSYAFYIGHNDSWSLQYQSTFWMEYDTHQGLYRAILHTDIPDYEDYCVRYRIIDDILYFEEPTDEDNSIQFKRIGDIE